MNRTAEEELAYQWRWVGYKHVRNIIGVPMYYSNGAPTPEYMTFCAVERITKRMKR